MSLNSRLRTPNPHLGAFYGIITSAFVSLAIMLALFEQLGSGKLWLAYGMLVLPLALYVAVAAVAQTLNVEDFFASGRRVPPIFNGFVLAAVAVGGTGYFAYTGTVFFLGFDALAIGLGLAAGMLAAAILFVPYLRKAGAYTLPSFLGHRFRSRTLRVAASVLLIPPTSLLLAAEMKVASLVAALFLPLTEGIAVIVMAAIIASIALFGGMRSVTWSGSAAFIVGAIGLSVPLIVVSVLITNLPAAQLTYGETFQSLQNLETTSGLSPSEPGPLATALPTATPMPNTKPFLQPFGAIGKADFVALFLCLTLGTAALPSLLTRSGVTATIADQRRSCAWAVLLVSLFAISAPALAAFAKLLMFQDIAQIPASTPPDWLAQLNATGLGHSSDVSGDGVIVASELSIARDAIALTLPMAAKLPFICTLLMAAGGIAIAVAAASCHLFTVAGSIAEDIVRVIDRSGALPRLMAAWMAIGAVALAAAVFLALADIDVLHAAITAFAFAASTFFPVLLLAIWWARCTALGAMLAMGTGFAVMALDMAFGGTFGGSGGLAAPVAALIGASLGVAAGVAGSLFGPAAAESGYFEELREPDGEAIYDRAQRRVAAATQ
jgi:cation/acetate symporter